MRFISGLILGVLLTVGIAYVHDAAVAGAMSGPDASGSRMVNWDVVSRSVDNAASSLRKSFERLIGHQSSKPTERI